MIDIVLRDRLKIILTLLLLLVLIKTGVSQDLNDTSKVIIKKISKSVPAEYNISDTQINPDKDNKNNFIIRVEIDVPSSTRLTLSVTDSAGAVVMYLINDQAVSAGSYRVRWEMFKCINRPVNCEGFVPGRYYCEFTTDQFIYTKDFFIK